MKIKFFYRVSHEQNSFADVDFRKKKDAKAHLEEYKNTKGEYAEYWKNQPFVLKRVIQITF